MNRVGDVTDRVRIAAARPTMKINIARRSRLPTLLLGIFSVVGAIAITWFVLTTRDGESTPGAPGRTPGAPARTAPAPSKSSSPPAEAAKPSAEAAKPSTEPASSSAEAAKPSAESSAQPAGEPQAKAVEPPAKVGEPAATAAEPAAVPPTQTALPGPSSDEAKPDPGKKKSASAAPQESHTKPVKKTRGKRASKAEPKEQTWNDDSPFMPVATPKH